MFLLPLSTFSLLPLLVSCLSSPVSSFPSDVYPYPPASHLSNLVSTPVSCLVLSKPKVLLLHPILNKNLKLPVPNFSHLLDLVKPTCTYSFIQTFLKVHIGHSDAKLYVVGLSRLCDIRWAYFYNNKCFSVRVA